MTKGKTRSVSKFFKELAFVFVMYIDLGLLNNNNKKTEKNLDVLYSTCLSHLFTSAQVYYVIDKGTQSLCQKNAALKYPF